ncbi:hypothetical protein C8T65DRAFT_783968 [Cerioporus squamosus]|nr:hypothetical protein C8T65DRAFT_783968 [Cerioporus squamosus]
MSGSHHAHSRPQTISSISCDWQVHGRIADIPNDREGERQWDILDPAVIDQHLKEPGMVLRWTITLTADRYMELVNDCAPSPVRFFPGLPSAERVRRLDLEVKSDPYSLEGLRSIYDRARLLPDEGALLKISRELFPMVSDISLHGIALYPWPLENSIIDNKLTTLHLRNNPLAQDLRISQPAYRYNWAFIAMLGQATALKDLSLDNYLSCVSDERGLKDTGSGPINITLPSLKKLYLLETPAWTQVFLRRVQVPNTANVHVKVVTSTALWPIVKEAYSSLHWTKATLEHMPKIDGEEPDSLIVAYQRGVVDADHGAQSEHGQWRWEAQWHVGPGQEPASVLSAVGLDPTIVGALQTLELHVNFDDPRVSQLVQACLLRNARQLTDLTIRDTGSGVAMGFWTIVYNRAEMARSIVGGASAAAIAQLNGKPATEIAELENKWMPRLQKLHLSDGVLHEPGFNDPNKCDLLACVRRYVQWRQAKRYPRTRRLTELTITLKDGQTWPAGTPSFVGWIKTLTASKTPEKDAPDTNHPIPEGKLGPTDNVLIITWKDGGDAGR